jgi:hypothetical protein
MIFTFLLFLFSLTVVLIIILGWSVLIGWILTLILPFELFEGTLLAMAASALGAYVLSHPPGDSSAPDWDDFPDFPDEIPIKKFIASESEKTWENWSRYEIANTVLDEFNDSLKTGTMTDAQLEALAIRMADAAVAVLKRKAPRSTMITVTVNQLRHQLQKMGLKPDDDDILNAAARGINRALLDSPIEIAVRQKSWSQPAPVVIDPSDLDDDEPDDSPDQS